MANQVAKDSIYTIIGTGFAFLSSIVLSILIARSLGPTDYGIYSLMLWLRVIAGLFADFGLSNAVGRFWPEYQGKSQNAMATAIANGLLFAQLLLSSTVGLFIVLAATSISLILNKPYTSDLLPIVAATVALATFNTFLRSFMSGMQRFREKAIIDIVTSTILIAGIVVLLILDLNIFRLLAFDLVVILLQVIVFLVLLQRSISLKALRDLNLPLIQHIAKYCVGVFIFTTLYGLMTQRSETFFISRYHDADEIAFYGIAFNIAVSVAILVPNALSAVTVAAMSKQFGGGDYQGMKSLYMGSVRIIALLTMPICMGTAAIARPLIESVYGAEFAPASTILQVLVVGAVAGSLVGLMIPVFWSHGDSRTAVLWLLPNTAITLTLSALIIPVYGVVGAAFANLISQLTMALSGAFVLKLRYGFGTPFVQLGKIFGAASTMGLAVYLIVARNQGLLAVLLGVMAGVVGYPLLLLLWRGIDQNDLTVYEEISRSLPFGLGKVSARLFRFLRPFAPDVRNRMAKG